MSTALVVSGRDARGMFARGNVLGHSGRPPASENKTTTELRLVKADFAAHWHSHTPKENARFLSKLRKDRPVDYAKIMTSLFPRDLEKALQPIEIVVYNAKQLALMEHMKRLVEDDGLPMNEAMIESLRCVPADLDLDGLDEPTELPASVAGITEDCNLDC